MPGKGLMVLIILFVAGSVYGLSLVDFTRDVPHYPPGYETLMHGGQPVPVARGPVAGVPENGGQPEKPADEPADEPVATEEVRISNSDILLTKISPEGTDAVMDPGDGSLVRIEIDETGGVRVQGFNPGDWDFVPGVVAKKLKATENAHVVVIPHQRTPWQYVHWVLEMVRAGKPAKVGLGAYPDFDEQKTLLYEVPVYLLAPDAVAEISDEMPEIVVTIDPAEDGKGATYTVFDDAAADQNEVYSKVASINTDYAEEFGGDYAKDVSKNPFVVKPDPKVFAGHVIVTLNTMRRTSLYTVRLGGEFAPIPGK